MTERRHQFPNTRWTLVLRVGEPEAGDGARRALEELCRIYWYRFTRSLAGAGWGRMMHRMQRRDFLPTYCDGET